MEAGDGTLLLGSPNASGGKAVTDALPKSTPQSSRLAQAEIKVIQLAIPGLALNHVRLQHRSGSHTGTPQLSALSQDPLVQTYLRRLAARGAAPNSVAAYRYQLRFVLRAAERLTGRLIRMGDLFRDVSVLGRVLVDAKGGVEGECLSKWTLAQRRSAVRSFASLMHPELVPLLGEDPHMVLHRALRGMAERVGGGYRLTGGVPRRRGGRAPTADEIAAVLATAGQVPGFVGARNRALFGILAATGTRVNALRHLDGTDCVVLPSGRVRLFLHEKAKVERREVELSRAQADALREYAEEFNWHASRQGWQVRVRLGEPGAIWRNSDRGRWSYDDVRRTLQASCAAAGVPPFAPHALRRAFATEAASALPRHVVALAGGWRGLERLDDHYVRPHPPTIWAKLRSGEAVAGQEMDAHVVGEAVATL